MKDAERPDLEPGEVHLWRATLDAHPDRVVAARSLLSSDERGRAAGMVSPWARRRWTVARATLRCVLARYEGVRAGRLELGSDRWGRPVVRGSRRFGGSGLRFSLARSEELVLIAVGCVSRLGVDLELVRPLAAPDSLARRCLSARERAALAALPAPDRPRALLACWTRKEAYLKALGVGLRVDPRRVETGLGGPPGAEVPAGRPGGSRGWTLAELEPEPGYVAALAVRIRAARLVTRTARAVAGRGTTGPGMPVARRGRRAAPRAAATGGPFP